MIDIEILKQNTSLASRLPATNDGPYLLVPGRHVQVLAFHLLKRVFILVNLLSELGLVVARSRLRGILAEIFRLGLSCKIDWAEDDGDALTGVLRLVQVVGHVL